jgi:hypothetical protein
MPMADGYAMCSKNAILGTEKLAQGANQGQLHAIFSKNLEILRQDAKIS